MKEYIEREAFIEAKRKQYCADCDRRKGMKNGKMRFCYEIGEAPCRACYVDDLLTDVEDAPAADVADAGYKAFAEWVARIIFNGGLEDEAFCELACRKLNDLGIVEKTENEWHLDDHVKSITPAYLVEKRHGRWINAYPEIEPNPMFMYGICSVCGFEQSVSDKLKYCPNCGTKMDGGADK